MPISSLIMRAREFFSERRMAAALSSRRPRRENPLWLQAANASWARATAFAACAGDNSLKRSKSSPVAGLIDSNGIVLSF